MSNLLDLLEKRHSEYDIYADVDISLEELENYVQAILNTIPSANNSQSQRAVIVSGEAQAAVWKIIKDIHLSQEDVLPAQAFANISAKMDKAAQAFATILLFEDRHAIDSMKTRNERAHEYKQQHTGMLALTLWLAVVDLGLGASLQHYNIGYEKGFDKSIKELLNLPDHYELTAQMPVG